MPRRDKPMLPVFYTVRILKKDDTAETTLSKLKNAVSDGGGVIFTDMQHIQGFVFFTEKGEPNPLKRAIDEYGDDILVEKFEEQDDAEVEQP